MLYNQIIGQTEAKQRLAKMANQNRVPHALLFSGKEGSGNLATAFAFAQHLFCSQKTDAGVTGLSGPLPLAERRETFSAS